MLAYIWLAATARNPAGNMRVLELVCIELACLQVLESYRLTPSHPTHVPSSHRNPKTCSATPTKSTARSLSPRRRPFYRRGAARKATAWTPFAKSRSALPFWVPVMLYQQTVITFCGGSTLLQAEHFFSSRLTALLKEISLTLSKKCPCTSFCLPRTCTETLLHFAWTLGP